MMALVYRDLVHLDRGTRDEAHAEPRSQKLRERTTD